MNRNRVIIYTHIGGWLLFLFLITSFLNNAIDSETWLQIMWSVPFLIFILFYVIVFYLNLYVLMPYLFLKKNYVAYTLVVVLLFVACFYTKPFERIIQRSRANSQIQIRMNGTDNRVFPMPPAFRGDNRSTPPRDRFINRPGVPKRQFSIDLISLILFFMTMAGSAMLVLAAQWRITEKNKVLVEIQKVNAELAFLKAQISPHFLFNTLNNIYALAITKSENTASGILRLSNIMRYVTEKAKEDFVPIEKEIAFINDFIALQELRLSRNSALTYEVTGVYENVKIAPLILIAFIENVFKHGISTNIPTKSSIAIHISELSITLRTQNTVIKKNENRNGIGLINVKQRLDVLYPDHYKLKMNEDDNVFTVVLVLDNVGT